MRIYTQNVIITVQWTDWTVDSGRCYNTTNTKSLLFIALLLIIHLTVCTA